MTSPLQMRLVRSIHLRNGQKCPMAQTGTHTGVEPVFPLGVQRSRPNRSKLTHMCRFASISRQVELSPARNVPSRQHPQNGHHFGVAGAVLRGLRRTLRLISAERLLTLPNGRPLR